VDQASGEHGEEGGTHRPQVGSGAYLTRTPQGLFGRHEGWRPEGGTSACCGYSGSISNTGNPKVEKLELTIDCEEEIIGFDISVNDPTCVRCIKSGQQLIGKNKGFLDFDAPSESLHPGIKGLALKQFKDEERRAVFCCVIIKNANRSWMVDLVGQVSLSQKTLMNLRIYREFAVQ
jgi:hypothetical protein